MPCDEILLDAFDISAMGLIALLMSIQIISSSSEDALTHYVNRLRWSQFEILERASVWNKMSLSMTRLSLAKHRTKAAFVCPNQSLGFSNSLPNERALIEKFCERLLISVR